MRLTESMIFTKRFSENYKRMCLTTQLYGMFIANNNFQLITFSPEHFVTRYIYNPGMFQFLLQILITSHIVTSQSPGEHAITRGVCD